MFQKSAPAFICSSALEPKMCSVCWVCPRSAQEDAGCSNHFLGWHTNKFPRETAKYLVLVVIVSTFPESWVGMWKHWDTPALQQECVCRDQGLEGWKPSWDEGVGMVTKEGQSMTGIILVTSSQPQRPQNGGGGIPAVPGSDWAGCAHTTLVGKGPALGV